MKQSQPSWSQGDRFPTIATTDKISWRVERQRNEAIPTPPNQGDRFPTIATTDKISLRRSRQCNEAIPRLMPQQYFIYLMTNPNNTVIYTGVTNDLIRRVYEHKNKLIEGFTKKYNVVKLVYYEIFDDPTSAINREKQIKGGSRKKKVDLINSMNEQWQDLYDEICL